MVRLCRVTAGCSGWKVADGSAGAFVHGKVSQTVGVLVFSSQDVFDTEGFEPGCTAFGFFVEGAEVRAFDAVFALHLLDHQLGISDDAQMGIALRDGEFEGGEEGGVFGEVVGFYPEEFVQLLHFVAIGVFDANAVAGRAGIAAGTAIAEGGDPWAGLRARLGCGRHVPSLEEPAVESGAMEMFPCTVWLSSPK